MRNLFLLIATFALATLWGCKSDAPIPAGEAADITLNGQTISGTVIAFRQETANAGEVHTITFANEDYTLAFQLFELSTGPLTTGKVLTYVDDGNPKAEIILNTQNNGQPDPQNVFNLLSGTITIDEYDETVPSISLSFNAELIKTIDLSSTRSISGSFNHVKIDE